MAWVTHWKPAASNTRTASRYASRSGQKGAVPEPLESGSKSHAVPDSTTPSRKNLIIPARHSRPRRLRSATSPGYSDTGVPGSTLKGTRTRTVS